MNWKRSIYSALALAVITMGALVGVKAERLFSKDDHIPKIDIHAHYNYDRAYLTPVLDAWNMQAVSVNVVRKPGQGRDAWQAMRALHEQYSERILLCTAFDPFRVTEPDFAEQAIAQLRQDIEQGARMVKVWKVVGMEVQDESGEYVHIDDPRFQPIWDFLVEEDIPVLAHIGEPRAAWQPLDPESPHYGYYRSHPEYHAYQHPEIPRWEEIMAARDRWLAANPELTVVGAHLGSMAYDVSEVAERLDAYPNFYMDTAARFGDLINQPSETVRRFFIDYQERILYGTDMGISAPEDSGSADEAEAGRVRVEQMLSTHWRYLTRGDAFLFESPMASSDAPIQGLNLPSDVVKKVYYRNAARVLDVR